MRRVVVTGMGMCTPLGYGVDYCWKKLINSKSGIRKLEGFEIDDLNSKVGGQLLMEGDKEYFLENVVDAKEQRKTETFIQYALAAAKEAISNSGWEPKNELDNSRTGVLIGSGIGGLDGIRKSSENLLRGPRKISPFFIPSCLINLASGHISIKYGYTGPNHSVVTACASGAHAIGDSMRLIMFGDADVMVAGGSEAACTRLGIAGFGAMRALSTKFNNEPEKASRPWDIDRDGFVLSEGAGILVLEEYEHAKARGAKIYAELTGYGATSDGYDMVAPSGEGAVRCMKMAMATSKNKIDYINTHGTSTPVGDITELNAVKEAFGNEIPKISSTKSLSGHPLGAASVHEAIYCLIMMKNNFIAGSANINEMDDEAKKFPIVAKTETGATLNTVMSNSFGFGGTNAALIFEKI